MACVIAVTSGKGGTGKTSITGGVAASLFSVKLVQVVEPDYLGRAASLFNATGSCVTPLVSAAIAGLVAFFSFQAMLLIGAAAAAVVLAILARLKLCYALNQEEKPAIMEGEQSLGAD